VDVILAGEPSITLDTTLSQGDTATRKALLYPPAFLYIGISEIGSPTLPAFEPQCEIRVHGLRNANKRLRGLYVTVQYESPKLIPWVTPSAH
jgi:hypothetical protein